MQSHHHYTANTNTNTGVKDFSLPATTKHHQGLVGLGLGGSLGHACCDSRHNKGWEVKVAADKMGNIEILK